MYTVSCIFDRTADTMKDARAMASVASHAYGCPADIISNKTGEILAHYENGHEHELEWE